MLYEFCIHAFSDLIKKYLFKPINDILEKRQNLADKAIKEAREAKEEADSLKDQYESSLTNAHSEAAQIVSDAQKEAQVKADAMVHEAQKEAADIKARAAADIEQEKKKANSVLLFPDTWIKSSIHSAG